jgi:replicative DNA helicase
MSAGFAVEAEWAVLGALMVSKRAYRLMKGLSPAHFADPLHGLIFDEITSMIAFGETVDASRLLSGLTELGICDHDQLRRYLAQLLLRLPSVMDIAQCRDAIVSAWAMRAAAAQ